ncbi:sugar ABC transporter ATP-binding protein [Rhodobacter sp. Har01]|uniref:sugar ABC transporter ATP-binding protein n=1 Tax=Rhodobacter sp. Har01 TaxID=2883999 RepID=UPI001D08C1F8|nr:sugar ABC transporter ATP-binding protein [Rhodobacter sp. Har01]MCB6177627.1 sugar ABC transporter ATP-binding protein [Rhodobacter sp. Har01]
MAGHPHKGNPNAAPLVALRDVWKVFEGVPVLRGIDFEVRTGEVHALLGGNGSGKSTLVKILSGAYPPTEGHVEIGGRPEVLPRPSEAHRQGVYMVPQEPHIFPSLTVLENLTMGLAGGRARAEEARRIAREIGLAVRFDAPGGELSIANQQLVEIIRGLLRKARVLILDEPTSSLTRREVDALAAEMRALTARGIGILFISHRLDEVLELATRVSVLRDGHFVLSTPADGLTADQLVEAMLPADYTPATPGAAAVLPSGDPVLEVRGLTGRAFRDVNFRVLPGEVVGIAGVVGSGRTELAEAIFGIDPDVTGEVRICGRDAPARAPRSCQAMGLSYVPEDRHAHGIFLTLPSAQTITAGLLALGRRQFLRRGAEDGLSGRFIDKLRIKLTSAQQVARTLSGGNQQKVVLAKTLAPEPRAVILDEPTRGIDARARQDVYRIIRELTAQGVGVVVISSEMGEVAEISDRVLVMRRGRMSALRAGRSSVEEISAATFAHVCGTPA